MRTLTLAVTSLAIIGACSATSSARDPYAVLDSRDIELKAELVGSPPLPFQPVRVRLTKKRCREPLRQVFCSK